MNADAIPIVYPPKPRLRVVRAGQTWFAKLPGRDTLSCVHVEETTPKTVVLRAEQDLGNITIGELATRYARVDVVFVERVP